MSRILLVDDEEGLLRVMSRYLTKQGHEVTAIGDYTGVRERLDAREFDIAFLDVCMPRMSGPDVCAALRIAQKADGFELVEPPPIILMTGYPELINFEFIDRIGGGVYCCLAKPFTFEEVDEVIECCLGGQETRIGATLTPGLMALRVN